MVRNNIHLVGWTLGLALLLGLSRVIPHPPNFTPIIAAAAFAPFIFKDTFTSIVVVFIAMLVGDLVYGFHPYMLYTYGSLVIAYYIGRYGKNIFANAFASSIVFFLITNFGVWITGYYGYTLAGLWTCYVAAIPFFGNQFLGTMLYTLGFFVILESQKWLTLKYK